MSDKRRDPRVKAHKQIWLEGQEQRLSAQTQNLSKGGMFILTDGDSPKIGQELEIRFDDSEEGSISLKMEVVWREDGAGAGGVGLKALGSAGREAFERVVNRHIAAGDSDVPESPPKGG
jgi:hypothetical protein